MGCGIAIVKYLVFIFNLVFAIFGLALLVSGAFFALNLNLITDSAEQSASTAPIFLIVFGALVFIISFFGCCGAIKAHSCMLKTYATFLVILLILQVAIGIYYFFALNEEDLIRKDVEENVQEAFNKYNSSMESKETFDDLQQMLKCCGVQGPQDWHGEIPLSCCKNNPSTRKTCGINDDDLFHTGCSAKGFQSVLVTVRAVGYVLFATCIFELIGIFCAFYLITSVKHQYRRNTYA